MSLEKGVSGTSVPFCSRLEEAGVDLGFRVWGIWFRVFRVQGSGSMVHRLGCLDEGLECKVWGLCFRVLGWTW